MKTPLAILQCLISLAAFCIGCFFALKPMRTIELQKGFYARINWRIEPISLEKELRNTRLMGFFLIALSLASAVFVFLK